ncbi:protein TOPAZ1 isoform X2 [Dendrobates tinctorius]|uniref:protein TOPAZ1 isoform X2 n=1 Tax=Dendrobates tinctorius TaxID=92724 RepID=UPI003CC99D36
MIELRPRKLVRLQLSVSGPDRAVGDAPEEGGGAGPAAESCPQVPGAVSSGSALVKKGRKPKIRTPVQCKRESGETPLECEVGAPPVTSPSQDQGPVKKRRWRPKPLKEPGCAQPSCVSEAPCPQKKRERKPKASQQSIWDIPKSGQGTAVPRETGHGTSGRVPDGGVGPKDASTQNSEQVKKRGRQPKIQPVVTCEQLETGDTSHGGKCPDMDSGSKEQDQVSVCSGGGPPERKKGGKNLGSGNGVKNQAPQVDVKGFSCPEKTKVPTARIRLQRCLLSQVSKKTGVPPGDLKGDEKNQLPEPQPEEKKSCAELTIPETKPTNPRRIKRIRLIAIDEKQKISAEQDTSCLTPASKKDEDEAVKCTMSESKVVKCSSNLCHVHSPGLKNPVVCLPNCKSFPLHTSNKRSVGPRKMQSQTSHINSVALESDSISALENFKHNEKVVDSAAIVKYKSPVKTILKVKFNFRKRVQKNENHSEQSDIELKSIDHQNREDCTSTLNSSKSQNETLMDKLNNTIKSAGSDYTDEESKNGTYPICSPKGSWCSQAQFSSDEIINHDADKSCSVTVSPSNISEAKEGLAVSCQRVIPFTGKTIRKWSCARTYVSLIPRKRRANVQNTISLGIEIHHSQEIHSDAMHSLVESNEESIQKREQENEREATCKRSRLGLLVQSTAPSKCVSSEATLDESLSVEHNIVREELLTTVDACLSLPLASESSVKNLNRKCCKLPAEVKDPSVDPDSQQVSRENETCLTSKPSADACLSLPLASESSVKNLNRKCCKLPAEVNDPSVEHDSQQVSRENETCLTSKPSVEVEIDQQTVTNPVPFNVPNEESISLLHIGVPVECSIEKALQNEVCSTSKALEEVNTNVLYDGLKSSHNYSDSEDAQSNCCPSEGFAIGDSVKHEEPLDCLVTLAPSLSKKSTHNNTLDLLKAYEEDVLVLDVNEDDPELFDFSFKEEEERFSKQCCNAKSNNMPSISKVQKKSVSPPAERKKGIKKIEYVPESNTIVINDFFDDSQDTDTYLPETNEVTTFAEMEESGEPKVSQEKDSPIELHHASMLAESSSLSEQVLHSKRLFHTQQPAKSVFWKRNSPPLQKYDFHFHMNDRFPTETATSHITEKWKQKVPRIQQTILPSGYCFFFFNTIPGCNQSRKCPFLHVPRKYEEKVCMDLLRKLINENNMYLLKRAVWMFRSYYSEYRPRLDFDKGILGDLLNPLVNLSLWQDLFDLLETAAVAKIFPSLDQIIKVFESVAFSGLQIALSSLLDVFCKLVHNGLSVTPMDIYHIITIMCKSSAAKNHINILLSIKSSLELKLSKTNWAFDMDAAVSEVEHCKDNNDWMKLGTLYLTVCTGCEDLTVLNNFSRCIAEALKKDEIKERPEIPFCEFADFIFKCPQFNDIQKNTLGRIGISVMFFYHGKEQWIKGRKVIYKFHELKINYTILKGISGQESCASRCHMVNVAVEIFLKCGNLGSAVQTLKECNWVINTSMWPCDMMDVLHRHNLLCLLVQEAISKHMFNMGFDVLQNLPGFQKFQGALTLRFYPLFEGKTDLKILYIPSFMSEVEMLMTIEHFMVSNASSFHSRGGCNQTLQIVLKRMEKDNAKSENSYHAATERLFEASRLSTPRLFIKHMTVNSTNEQVYTLDNNSSLKWLNKNMKWAGNVWCSLPSI